MEGALRMRFGRFMAGRACVIAVLATLTVGPGGSSAANAAGFLPHRAVYDLSLAKSSSSSVVAMVRAEGKLEFEWADVCTGWTISQRTRVRMVTSEGRTIEFGWSLNALESRDGQHYRFFIHRVNADGSDEELRGAARFPAPGQRGTAVFDAPESRKVTLAKDTLFPTAHSLALMEAAATGALPLWRTVFDGSGDDGRFGVNAALTETLAADARKSFESPLLRDQKSWRLRLRTRARTGAAHLRQRDRRRVVARLRRFCSARRPRRARGPGAARLQGRVSGRKPGSGFSRLSGHGLCHA
jgi:hypothetical protein